MRRQNMRPRLVIRLGWFLCTLMMPACVATMSPPSNTDVLSVYQVAALRQADPLVDLKFIRQQASVTCGLAALASVADFWGRWFDQMRAFRETPPADLSGGYSLGELKSLARSLDLEAFAVPGDESFVLQQLRQGRPSIVPVRKIYKTSNFALTTVGFIDAIDHYVVVAGALGTEILLVDPEDGFVKVDRDLFRAMRQAHGNAVLLVGRRQTDIAGLSRGVMPWSAPISVPTPAVADPAAESPPPLPLRQPTVGTPPSSGSPSPGGYGAQLASFRLAASVTPFWNTVTTRHGDALAERRYVLRPFTQRSGQVLHQLILPTGQDRTTAAALCAILAGRGLDCLVTRL